MSFAPTTITMSDAADVVSDGVKAIQQGATTIDLTQLTHFDSSAVSALVAWHRAAAEKNRGLELIGLPTGLHSLAQLYGVDVLLYSVGLALSSLRANQQPQSVTLNPL